MNRHSILAIYRFEMSRFRRTLWQSLVTPVITTSLYFIVFGAAIGSRMDSVEGVPYGAFSGFRWSFYGTSDVPVGISLGGTL